MSIFSLEGKRALVTGGGAGIGRAITESLIEQGARVVISGRREDALAQAVKELGTQCSYVVGDVSDLSRTAVFVKNVLAGGQLDILVNNAGINRKKPVWETTDADFSEIHATNLFGLFALTREVAKHMMENKSGSILNIVSMASIFGLPQVSAYCSSKSAVQGLTRELASELSPYGITVNAVAPGFIDTAMSRKAFEGDPERKRKVLSRTPMNRLGDPKDVAHAVAFLVSPAASYITGTVLPVDGGTSIGF